MMEELFEQSHGIIIIVIVIVVGLIIMASVMGALGIFESSKLPESINITNPTVTCSGDNIRVSIPMIEIAMPAENMKIMPVVQYQGAIGYDTRNFIDVVKGVGNNSASFDFKSDKRPRTATVWLTLSFWKWSPLGCLNQTISETPDADYQTIIDECAEDFITAQSVTTSKVINCIT